MRLFEALYVQSAYKQSYLTDYSYVPRSVGSTYNSNITPFCIAYVSQNKMRNNFWSLVMSPLCCVLTMLQQYISKCNKWTSRPTRRADY